MISFLDKTLAELSLKIGNTYMPLDKQATLNSE